MDDPTGLTLREKIRQLEDAITEQKKEIRDSKKYRDLVIEKNKQIKKVSRLFFPFIVIANRSRLSALSAILVRGSDRHPVHGHGGSGTVDRGPHLYPRLREKGGADLGHRIPRPVYDTRRHNLLDALSLPAVEDHDRAVHHWRRGHLV